MTPVSTDLELLGIQIDALFTHNAMGHIVSVNEPNGRPAPRFFLGRTREGNLWRVRHDVPDQTRRQLEMLAAAEPVRDDLEAMPVGLDAMLELLGSDRETASGRGGPAYRFPGDIPDLEQATRITRANSGLLSRMADYLDDITHQFEEREPRFVVVADGAAVAICNSARLTDLAAEAGIDTLEDYRGRGYAAVVVAAWAREIRASGRIPLYSTSWGNLASQAVARKLGLVQYAADLNIP